MSATDQNKALVRRLVEVVNEAQLDAVDEVASGELAKEARRWIGPFRASFPDFRMEIVNLVAEDDKVAAHFKCSGTHEGEWRGHAPSGRRFEGVDEIYIFRAKRGRLTGALAVVEDDLSRMRQLGIRP